MNAPPPIRLVLLAALAAVAVSCKYESFIPAGGASGGGRNTGFVDGVDPARCPATSPLPPKASGEACACGVQCQSGTCVGGICCTGSACNELRPLGIICQADAQCVSGFCADGVCCNVACTGACVACNRPEQMGQCVPIPTGGEDRHGICRRDPPESCGQTGYCNGAGGCARHGPTTVCRPPACVNREQFVAASLCDGEGTCVFGGSGSCRPSTCDDGRCAEACLNDDQCLAPATCENGSCGKRGAGQDCTAGSQCASGFCVDGVCCESACEGPCTFCADPTARGRCVPGKAGAPDPRAARGVTDPARICADEGPTSCGRNGRCDGQGGCQRYADGTVCSAASCNEAANQEIPAATCMAGQCRPPSPRSCAPYQGCSGGRCRTSCASEGQCATGNVCTAGDCGKRPSGAVCTRAADCSSGFCAQGRCCASACSGTCQSCALAGQEGTCTSVPAGGADPSGTCQDDACSNGCDGNGGCRREALGTVCAAARCEGNNLFTSRCASNGACLAAGAACAAGQMCQNGACVTPPMMMPAPTPAPMPAPTPSTKYFCDTFGTASGYRRPDCLGSSAPECRPVGRLFAANNYVFCKRWGHEMRVGADFNHWWLLTDLDENFPGFSGRAWVSAYYLRRWGNDVAKDNNGQVIPDCP